ncbi:hypothetical protein N9P07_05960, partial [Alphaproteobacteria bacterium]|nr:hypothetical protein [Alphaproteobacteria bacterium]
LNDLPTRIRWDHNASPYLAGTLSSNDISPVNDILKIINKIAVTNVSDALCALSLSGLKVRELLSKGCAIDLHPDSFGRNKSVQCDLALANVIIACIEANETDEFLCICRTSFAEYVLDWMIDAGYEFGIIARSYA